MHQTGCAPRNQLLHPPPRKWPPIRRLRRPAPAAAEEAGEEAPPYADYAAFTEQTPAFALFTVNNLWILISAALVFIMHLGFASVESGLCQSKNTVNILFKNVFIVCIGALGYMLWGFNGDVSG